MCIRDSIVGEIDVSVGSTLGFVATVVGSLLRDGCNWLVAFAAGILIGALVGLINGDVYKRQVSHPAGAG